MFTRKSQQGIENLDMVSKKGLRIPAIKQVLQLGEENRI